MAMTPLDETIAETRKHRNAFINRTVYEALRAGCDVYLSEDNSRMMLDDKAIEFFKKKGFDVDDWEVDKWISSGLR